MKTIALLVLSAGLAVACGGTDEGGDGSDAPSAITINTSQSPPARFSPATAVLAAGGTVTFRNISPVEHNVTSATNAWPVAALDPAEEFSVTLANPGNYAYQCTLHEGMTGLISVQ